MDGEDYKPPETSGGNGPTDDASIHPGFLLRRELLDPSGMSQRDFARLVGLSPRTLNEIVCGKRPITRRTARKLKGALRAQARIWLSRQARYNAWEDAQDGSSPSSDP